MKKVLITLSFLLVLGIQAMLAQTRSISGTVTDANDGGTMPGVTVAVKGSSSKTATDTNGKYAISVGQNAEALVFSFMGMKTVEVPINNQSEINVSMTSDDILLNEVIFVGYGTSRREANTGALGVVKSNEISDVPEVSFDKMLAGKVPGLTVTGTSGQPGASTEIRIRGISSLNAGNEPLYVIDGVPLMSVTEGSEDIFVNTINPLAAINPNDIESITVLKDAAAASIYGSRAANGVILITTKSGKAGKSVVKFRTSHGVTMLANDNTFRVMNPQELVSFMRDAVVNAGLDPDDPRNGTYYVPQTLASGEQTNWVDAVTRNGQIQEYEVSVSGGDDKTKHFTSLLYSKNEGIFYAVDYEKYQIRSNIEHKISNAVTIGTRVNLYNAITNDVPMQDLYYANPLFAGMTILPWNKVKNDDGTYNLFIPENAYTNPLATAAYDEQWDKQWRSQIAGFLEWKPVKGLTLKTNNAYEYADGEGRRLWSEEATYIEDPIIPSLQTTNLKYEQMTTSNTLTYTNLFGDLHNFTGIAGQEAIINKDNFFYISSPGIDPQIPFHNTGVADTDQGDYGETQYTMLSFFGILDYNYDDTYFLKFSLRTDGSSKFGINNRWGDFYAVGASWNMNNESFMSGMDKIDMLKLRASYGANGNDNIGTYEQWGVYTANQYNGTSGMYPMQPQNSDLTWEINRSLNVGIDFSFLNSKVYGSLDVYNRVTDDMLLDTPTSYTYGFSSMRQNIGKIKNSGIETLINVNVLDNKSLTWDLGLNLSHNKSKILDLGGQDQIINGRLIHKVGESLYNFYIREYAGVNPANGEALWIDNDGALTNDYTNAPRKIMGSPEPKLMGGLNSDLSWNNFTLNVNLEFKYGNKVLIEEMRYLSSDGYSWGTNHAASNLDYWKEVGDIAANPKPIADNSTNSAGFFNSRWMYDGSYLRIKNVSLGYKLPTTLVSKARLTDVRFYASATNLFTFHKVNYFDPERGVEGMGVGIYPMTKNLVVGLEISF